MPNSGAQQRVGAWFIKNMGLATTLNDLEKELDLPRVTINGAITRLRNKGWNIPSPMGAGSYVFKGEYEHKEVAKEVRTTPELMEVVGRTKDDVLLLRSEDGILYKAVQLVL